MSTTRVAVVGGGIAGLTAAFDLAASGLGVVLLEPNALGGTVRRDVVDGLPVDVGADSFAVSPGTVQRLLADLDLANAVVAPAGGRAWVRFDAGFAPLPAGGWMGIPSHPWAADTRRVIGPAGSIRAMADALLPARFGRTSSLAGLIRTRLGGRVLRRLVEPVVGGVYSSSSDAVSPDALPGPLRQALQRQRTLTGAVRQVTSGAAPGAAVAGLDGGMFRLVERLTERVEQGGGRIVPAAVTALRPVGGRWQLTTSDAAELDVDAVAVATDRATAAGLLGLPPATRTPGDILLCTLVVTSAELDEPVRGTGVLVAPDVAGIQAKALTHATAKWGWLATAAGPGRHVLRLSYGRTDQPAPDRSNFPRQALHDASALLGVPLALAQLRDWRLTRWQPSGVPDQTPLELPPSVALTGAWRSGTGLAAVVGSARAAAAGLVAALGSGVIDAARREVAAGGREGWLE